MDQADKSNGSAATPVLVLLFVATRVLLFTNFQLGSEIERAYSKPALEIEQAGHHGISFYDYHEQHIQRRIDEAKRQGKPPLTDEMKKVEYPPLAIVVMYLPKLFAGAASEDELDHPGAVTARYVVAYRVEMALVDGLIFILLAYLIPRLFADETRTTHQERLLIYILTGAVLGHLLYDRLDLVLGGLLLAALVLLISRFHYVWSFLVLATAVNFKLVPVVLFPVWVLASLRLLPPSPPLRGRGDGGEGEVAGGITTSSPPTPLPRVLGGGGKVLLACAGRSVLLIGLTVAVFAPFLLISGSRCLEFLSFHQERGLQVESVPSSLLLVLGAFGYPVELTWGHGAFELTAPLAPLLGTISTAMMAVLLLAASALLAIRLVGSGNENSQTLAQRDPKTVLTFSLLFLMTALATSKVFSPQFLLWLLPLIPLAPLSGRARRWFQWGLVGVAVVTTVVFPYVYLYIRLLYPPGEYAIPPVTGSLAAVSGGLLVLRNAIFLLLTGALWVWTWRTTSHVRAL